VFYGNITHTHTDDGQSGQIVCLFVFNETELTLNAIAAQRRLHVYVHSSQPVAAFSVVFPLAATSQMNSDNHSCLRSVKKLMHKLKRCFLS